MNKSKRSLFALYIILFFIIFMLVYFMIIHTQGKFLPHFIWENEPLHSSLEAMGALIALGMSLLLLQRRQDEAGGRSFMLSMGFLSMGILGGFHSFSFVGKQFVFLYSLSLIFGGFCFGLILLPRIRYYIPKNKSIILSIAAVTTLTGLWTLIFPDSLPPMVVDGGFSPLALKMNLFAGILFLAASLRFLLDFNRSKKQEHFLFLCFTVLFAIAGFSFKYSELWSDVWWLWHILRMLAYLLVLRVIIVDYQEKVSDLAKKQAIIIQQGKYMQDILESVTHPIYVIDVEDYTVKMANRAAGSDRLYLNISTCYELTHGSDKPCSSAEHICPLEKAKKTKKPVTVEHTHLDKDGNKRTFQVYAYPIFNEKGEVRNIVEYLFDITDSKRIEDSLEETKESLETQAWGLKKANESIRLLYKEMEAKNKELQRLDDLKSEFISNVSHELRTPLTTIKEFASILSDEIPGKINKEQGEYLGIMKGNIDRLTRLINDLLDISKIEAGKLELKKTLLDINDIAADVIFKLKPKADEKSIEIQLSSQKPVSEVYVDSDKIIQVFTNLIGNAIKFTPEKGKIIIEIREREEVVECSVTDTGIGITAENLEKVFIKFQQFGRTAGSGSKGTGLGLAITKELIQIHGGKIWVESKFAKGSKFTFSLPKYTAKTLFKEYIDVAIIKAEKNDLKMCFFFVSMHEQDSLRKSLPKDEKESILKDMEVVLRNNLRKEDGCVLRGTENLGVILFNCDRDNALRVEGRVGQILEEYLDRKRIADKIRVSYKYALYPEEGRTYEELIKKIRQE
ncbi:MAG: ATP-binding protein [Candidatus Omnitrophota bacterium]